MQGNAAPLPKPTLRPRPLAPRPPMIAAALNSEASRYLRLCTPSILEGQARVHDPYATDISISTSGIRVVFKG